jgi:NAD(P)-dependent dehydrogenase (short-subunit alcohol dehydrogenase family)
MDLQDRVAIVTGGTGALGSAVAVDLLQRGVKVAVPYMAEPQWKALQSRAGKDSVNLWGSKVDLTQAADVKQFAGQVIEHWKRIDFLVCIAGGFAAGKIHETSEESWDLMFNVNLRSVYLAVRAVVPQMIQQSFGRVITTSSAAILNGGGAGIAAYAISKGAMRQLTEILAAELNEHNIHAHCILPGTMDTEANRRDMPKSDFSTWVKVEDVANVVRFLLSDDARSIRSVAVPVLGQS